MASTFSWLLKAVLLSFMASSVTSTFQVPPDCSMESQETKRELLQTSGIAIALSFQRTFHFQLVCSYEYFLPFAKSSFCFCLTFSLCDVTGPNASFYSRYGSVLLSNYTILNNPALFSLIVAIWNVSHAKNSRDLRSVQHRSINGFRTKGVRRASMNFS
ncbi:hypothetical protein Y032_0233g3070 [Ancylostoma ceylanicum]|uniref:7TM GPCR serpentine receptor class x (Srx) domain-containing protein n=1 Tax=Ancylostoma ceylanicum TaxID=53326 RepID=A0A016SFZ7_9BILA|nr:hypothetical protein Y032_0233g3070 [Ancylostoma ceylanicum]